MLKCPLATPRLLIADWPPELRHRFQAGAGRLHWRRPYADTIRRQLESYYGHYTGSGGDIEAVDQRHGAVDAFLSALQAQLAPRIFRHHRQSLWYGLLLVAPEQRWDRLRPDRPPAATGPRPARRRRTPRLGLPFADWPAPLRLSWVRKLAKGASGHYRNPGQQSRAATWSPAYAARVQRGFAQYLQACRRNQLPLAVTETGVGQFVDGLEARGCSPVTIASYVWEVREAADLLLPGDWAWLDAFARRLQAVARPLRLTHGKLVQTTELRRLGVRLMTEASRRLLTPRTATLYRDGLMIALLAERPIRCRNFAALALGSSLVLGDGGGYIFCATTKNGRPYDAPLPPWLLPYLLAYSEDYRPLLLRHPQQAHLWLGRDGAPLSAGTISARIGNLTQKHLGKRIPPHWFRHCLATTVSELDPGMRPIVPVLLGHHDGRTADKYYDFAGSIGAAKRLEALLEEL